jgi:hypothetical protein
MTDKPESEPGDDLAATVATAFATATALSSLQILAVVAALSETGAVDPRRVADLAERLARPVTGEPGAADLINAGLRTFAHELRALPAPTIAPPAEGATRQ